MRSEFAAVALGTERGCGRGFGRLRRVGAIRGGGRGFSRRRFLGRAGRPLDALVSYDRAIFGAALFFFIGWTFVGIHHAVMDNVIWRRENPRVPPVPVRGVAG